MARGLGGWIVSVCLGIPAAGQLAPPSVAAVVHVPADHPTIQAGIDAAADGDTVLVAPGVYTGDGNHSINFSLSTLPDAHNVVLRSEAGAEATVIDVDGAPDRRRRGFVFQSGEGPGSVVEGFTIRNGYMSDPIASSGRSPDPRHELSGGGMVFRYEGTDPTIRDCVIEACTSFYSGGGIEAEFFAEPTFERCVFRGNQSFERGGGASLETFSGATFVDCTFTGNVAGIQGGGLQLETATTLEGCLVAGNRAGRGGGVDVRFPAVASIERTIVRGNCTDGGLGPDVYVGNDGTLSFGCSAVDTTRVDALGTWTFVDGVVDDPLLCGVPACTEAPTPLGSFELGEASPCRASASPCGARIGPFDVGCVTPVVRRSWSALKRRHR